MASVDGMGLSEVRFVSETVVLSSCGVVADSMGVGAELNAGVEASEREK